MGPRRLVAGEHVQRYGKCQRRQQNVSAPQRVEDCFIQIVFVPCQIGVVNPRDQQKQDRSVNQHFECAAGVEQKLPRCFRLEAAQSCAKIKRMKNTPPIARHAITRCSQRAKMIGNGIKPSVPCQ